MGRDKALLPVDGIPLASRVARAMRAAGVEEIFTVGGDAVALQALGLAVVPDRRPGEGPLGGIVTALAAATFEIVVVSACDMPWLAGEHVRALLDTLTTLDSVDVVVSAADGQLQPMHAAWRRGVLPVLEEEFARGERSPLRVVSRLPHAIVELGAGPWATDLDSPGDLPASG